MRFAAHFPGQQPIHPVLRVLIIAAGISIMAVLAIVGAFVLLGLVAAGGVALAIQRWRQRHDKPSHQAPRDTQTLEGEYVVIDSRPESS